MTNAFQTYQLASAGNWVVGAAGVSRIEWRRDGFGPMGLYDMIYVYFEDDQENPASAMPAHLVENWRYLPTDDPSV